MRIAYILAFGEQHLAASREPNTGIGVPIGIVDLVSLDHLANKLLDVFLHVDFSNGPLKSNLCPKPLIQSVK